MQMIDLLTRLAALDAANQSAQEVSIEEDIPAFETGMIQENLGMMSGAKDSLEKIINTLQSALNSGPDAVIQLFAKMGDDEKYAYYDLVKLAGELYNIADDVAVEREGEEYGFGEPEDAGSQPEQDLKECGMMEMGSMPSTQPHTPASISMTADSGEELSSMLADIMTLAGRDRPQPHSLGSMPAAAVIDVEPAGDGMGPPEMDATTSMRKVLDRMNDGDDVEKVAEYDNEPNPETTGYSANVPSGDDLHREKKQYPAAQPGDNAMAATFESLMSEYKKFVSEEQGVAEDMDSLTFWKREAQKAGGSANIDWYAIGVEHGKQGILMNPPYGVGAKAVNLYSKGLDAGEKGVAEGKK